MKRIILTSIFVILLASSQLWAAEVTNVEISQVNGVTQAQIDVNGPIRYMHQTEVAKDGKPYRVIVDILSATHELGGKVFEDLPTCPVTSVRTSQFAVKPEKVVRIVFDMKDELVYQIDNTSKAITITFKHPPIPAFASWSTSEYLNKGKKAAQPSKPAMDKPAVTPKTETKSYAQTNKAIEKDRLSSLADNDKAAAMTTQPKAEKPMMATAKPEAAKDKDKMAVVKPKNESAIVPLPSPGPTSPAKEKPKMASKTESVKTQAPAMTAQPKAEKSQSVEMARNTESTQTPAPAKTMAKSEPEVKKSAPESSPKPAAKKTSTSQEALAKKISNEKSTSQATDKSAKKQLADKPKAAPTKKADQQSKPKSSSKEMAKADKNDESKSRKSTARFRRSSNESAKIKGTMVAEFPKRLTIKYKASRYADPFRVLIDNTTQSSDHPIERKVPNIEGLKLVGVIESGEGANRALFEDNDGYGYMLTAGDKVRNGYVLRVDGDQVHFQIFEYGWSRTVALRME